MKNSDTSTTTCRDPEHNPPTYAGLNTNPAVPATFTHRCPTCGYGFTFAVGKPA